MSDISWTLRHAASGSPFFRDLLAGRTDDPPFTTKEQLREAYPFGWTAVPLTDVVRIHASSGTTGKRTVATYTADDIEDWTVQFARCLEFAGVTAEDRVQIMVGYGLWTAGAGFQAAVERVGAMAIPTGPGNVELQLEFLRDFGTTVLCATSSFALLLAEEVERRGLRDQLALRVGVFGSERWGEAMRRRIEGLLGIETFDIYGLTELYGPGTGIECSEHDGIHYWDDYYVVEVVDTVDLTPIPPGEQGEVVLTTLRKQAMPLVRYRTRDISRLLPGPCRCGSPYPRIARLTGRTDDMIKVRGVAVYPAQVDSALADIDGLASEYQLHVHRDEARDRLIVKVETAGPSPAPGLATTVTDHLRTALGIRPDVDLCPPGTLTRSERKTRRVYDHRNE
jgi:phenylacetate-CoA ligase